MKYLIYNTELEANLRSAYEAEIRGVTQASITRYWWSWRETSDNKFALCIPDADVLSLSDLEQTALVDSVVFKLQDGL